MNARARSCAVAALALLLLVGCGMKGDLTRPPPAAPPAAEAGS
jgi:predicted small lipoprotein YifL